MGHEHGQKEATGILEILSILSLDLCFVSEEGTMERALGGLEPLLTWGSTCLPLRDVVFVSCSPAPRQGPLLTSPTVGC